LPGVAARGREGGGIVPPQQLPFMVQGSAFVI
jgi:hypothetical protein